MFDEFRRDPSSVSESWREFFQGYKPGGANLARPVLAGTAGPDEALEPGTTGAGAAGAASISMARRSIPAAHPTAGVIGPPISATSPS